MKTWTKEENDFIVKNYGVLSCKEIAEALDRTIKSIMRYANRHGLRFSEEKRAEISRKNIEKYRKQNEGLTGENNPNWKNGISKNRYRYKLIQKERYPERVRAREIIYREIKAGRLERQPCEVCGETPTFAHHDDYDKPLEVRWFCRKHHREQHGGRY